MKIESLINNQMHLIPVFGYKEYLMAQDGASECGYIVEDAKILPFVLKKRGIFRIAQIPCVASGCSTNEEKKQFVNKAVHFLSKSKSPDVIYTLNTNICSVFPDKADYCKFGSYIIDLSLDEDEIFMRFHTKHRNVVRKAIKDGLIVEHGEEFEQICSDIIDDTYKRQGQKGSGSNQFAKLKKVPNAEFWIVKQNDEVQGCAILLWSEGFSCYYLHGGSIAHPHSGALNLLHWEAIKKMKQRGVRYYDFVGARINPEKGSKLEGIQRFKSRFGGEMVVGYMWRYVNHKIRYNIYSLLLKLYLKYVMKDRNYKDIIKEERNKGNY